MLHDLLYGARSLRRTPVAALAALLTIAVAVGANAAIFSLLNVLVLRNLPVRKPHQLVEFIWQYPGDPPLNLFSVDNYHDYRAHNTVFSDIVGTAPFQVDAKVSGMRAASVNGECVTGNFFHELGVRTAFGRLIVPDDDRPGSAAVAVVSWRYWKERFNLESRVLGTQLTLAGTGRAAALSGLSATIVGVAHEQFAGVVVGDEPQVWLPVAACQMREKPGLSLMARLKDGTTIDAARAQMRTLDRARIEQFAARDPQWRQTTFDVVSARAGLSTPLRQQFQRPLWVLLIVAGGLMALACANIATLLLARGAARQRELAVRISLGARPSRIVRQMFTESLLLAGAGAMAGLVIAYLTAPVLLRIMTSGTRSLRLPPRLEVSIDGTVLLFSAGLMLFAALLFGLAPAIPAFASPPAAALKDNAAGHTTTRRRFGNGLVIAQVSLSLVLLSASSLFVGHLSRLRNPANLGFDRTSALLVSFDATHAGLNDDQLKQRYKELLDRFSALPGVRSATLSGMTPISGAAGSRFLIAEGFQEPARARERLSINLVAPRYFETYGTTVRAGRDFRSTDEAGPRVAIVNEATVRHYFAGRDPIGKHVTLEGEPRPYEIIGVVADAKYNDVRRAAPRTIYLDVFQQTRVSGEFTLRTGGSSSSLAGEIGRIAGDILNGAPITKTITLAEQVDASIVPERVIATLAGFFGVLAMLLTAIGLYGLMAYTVARRTREIAVRMSLGASPSAMMHSVLQSALLLVVAGLVVGAPVALWTKRVAAGMLENVPSYGLLPVATGALITVAVAVLAAYFPARRATRVDPLVVLRSE